MQYVCGCGETLTVSEGEVMSLSPIPSPGSSNTADDTSTAADSPVSGHNDEPATPHDTLNAVTLIAVYCALEMRLYWEFPWVP